MKSNRLADQIKMQPLYSFIVSVMTSNFINAFYSALEIYSLKSLYSKQVCFA